MAPDTSSRMSLYVPPAASTAATFSETEFLKTRTVLLNVRKMTCVWFSSIATILSLMPSWIGASWVARKRVPMFTPSHPSAKAAAKPLPSAIPPDATTGISSTRAAAGNRTRPPMSLSPGCPAHSNPSMLTTSTPSFSADRAWRTATHLWITFMPAALKRSIKGAGLRPAVSTILTPLLMMTSTYSS